MCLVLMQENFGSCEPSGYPKLFCLSIVNAEGSYCWISPIWVNQTQVDELHGTNLEPPFPFDLANPGGRRTHLSA